MKTLHWGSGLAAVAVFSLSLSSIAGEKEDITAKVRQLVGPSAPMSEVVESPMKGTYEITIGDRVMYASLNGKHLLLGDVYDVERNISLSEERKQARAAEVIDAIPEAEMIVYGDENAERTITVFTDVDCGFCQKLHKEVPQLVENNVKVRYLWFPRSGPNTASFAKAESVWCADDQVAAMDAAKLTRQVTDKICENPVLAQYQAGQKVGVRGTPTIVVDDGTIIGGYVPADRLLLQLGLAKK